MNEIHFNFLAGLEHNPNAWEGQNIRTWARQVLGPGPLTEGMPNERFTRTELADYLNEQGRTNLERATSIFAWGSMNRNHGHNILAIPNHWNHLDDLITQLCNGENGILNRIQAFDAFRIARINQHLPGLGIAYFTKLIFFLNPGLNGFIMDQWTSKSINLLFDDHNIHLYGNWVNNTNTAQTYDQFCERIMELAGRLNCPPHEAEERIFSVGRGRGEWRNYVIQHYH